MLSVTGRFTFDLSILFSVICTIPCHNGGTCVSPNQCSCMPGFTGAYCESGMMRSGKTRLRSLKILTQMFHHTKPSFLISKEIRKEGFV